MSTVPIEEEMTLDRSFEVSPAPERVELAERQRDGLLVSLHWLRGTSLVAVTVSDESSRDSFELVVAEDENALDVFHHPYAYARAHGVELRGGRHPEDDGA